MPLNHSPRKAVALASGDERSSSRLRSSNQPQLTRRVFFCGVVVENAGHGQELPPDVQDLVASLGDPVDLEPETSQEIPNTNSSTDLLQASNEPHKRKRATTLTIASDSPPPKGLFSRKRANTVSNALQDIINELVATERSYVTRLNTLKVEYADPLRTFSKSKETAIIPRYKAVTLFGNLDQLLPVNEAFLADLEKMSAPDGPETVGGVGDVALKHFQELRGFENYRQYYANREQAQQIFEQELEHRSFAHYLDHVKYSAADMRNRVGLRELLMEPVQRIPRYTLMFRTMIKHMAPHDPQRDKLMEADAIASKIALAETDEQTKQAAMMYCISSTVDDFPPSLIKHSRKFIDCIDVEDVLAPSPDSHLSSSASSSTGSSAGASLHCTLFLFDDKILFVKRPGDKSGRALTGLDDSDKVVIGKGLAIGSKKSGLVCKGVVEVVDVTATDVDGADFHLYLETTPQDQTDRWNGRPFRALSVIFPPSPVNLDPTRTELEKRRFLENLWAVQARYRTNYGQSVILSTEEREVESRGGRVTTAKTYFNLYQRTAYLKEQAKMKVVVHIDPSGSADPIPFGTPAGPLIIIRVQPMAGELSRYTVHSSDPSDDGEEDILHTARVPARIVQTIHQYGLFKFRTGIQSIPTTPTVSRSRAAIFGLDAISRNLFHARPGSSKDNIFGGSINTHKRSKTVASRSSMNTHSTATGESSLSRFSSRSRGSTLTVATSFEDDPESISGNISADTGSASSRRSLSLQKAKKLIKKRPKSPAGSGSELDASPAQSLTHGRSPSSDWYTDDDEHAVVEESPQDQSERDLFARLELARHNSRSQHDTQFPMDIGDEEEQKQVEEELYEDDPPRPLRPLSRASRASTRELPDTPVDSRPTSAMSRLFTPQCDPAPDEGERITRSSSMIYSPDRPRGPRTPSPLPSSLTPEIRIHDLPSEEDVTVSEETIINDMAGLTVTPRQSKGKGSPIPRSKRQVFDIQPETPLRNTGGLFGDAKPLASVEPLSIKRKPSAGMLNAHRRRVYNVGKGSPMSKQTGRVTSLSRRTSSQLKQLRAPSNMFVEDAQQLLKQSQSAKEGIESVRRSVRQLRQHYDQLVAAPSTSSRAGTPQPEDRPLSPMSPVKGLRIGTRGTPPPVSKEAQARMEEMQRLISRRTVENPARPRLLSAATDPLTPTKLTEHQRAEDVVKSVDELASRMDSDLTTAAQSIEQIHGDIERLTFTLSDKTEELDKARNDLANAKLQIALVKQLYDDSTAEKDALYDAFNEELDGMFNDASLPEDEAWASLTRDLTESKKAKNEVERQALQLQHELSELKIQKESYAALLRANGLIP